MALPRPALAEALARLGSQVRFGGLPPESLPRLPSGIAGLDRLLGGGFPCGRVSQIAGPLGSGRTSLALSLLARSLREGGLAAWVDAADAFDPASAVEAGAALPRVLWVRAPGATEAFRSAERLLETRGLVLVLLDLSLPGAPPRAAPAAWPRLARAAQASGTALVVLATDPLAGTSATVSVSLTAARAHFSAAPQLFEGLEVEARLARGRPARPSGAPAGVPDGAARLRLYALRTAG